jgi:hypothetical protein
VYLRRVSIEGNTDVFFLVGRVKETNLVEGRADPISLGQIGPKVAFFVCFHLPLECHAKVFPRCALHEGGHGLIDGTIRLDASSQEGGSHVSYHAKGIKCILALG